MNQLGTKPVPRRKKRNLFLPLFFFGLFLFLVLGMAGIAFVMFRFKSVSPTKVSRESVLSIDLDASVGEYHPAAGLELLFQEHRLYLHDYIDLIEKAATDEKIKGIYLVISPQTLGWAQLQELHTSLTDFRSTGKWVWAYGEVWTEKEYYLATAADRIYLPPEAMLLLDGLMSRTSFFAPALREIGIKVDVAAIGEYKNFADPYRYSEMTPAHQESIRALLAGMESELFSAIETGRELKRFDIRHSFETALYRAQEGLDARFFDTVAYPDEIADEMRIVLDVGHGRDISMVKAKDYYRPQRKRSSWTRNDQIALLFASGSIQSGAGERGVFGDPVIASETFISQLKAARKDPGTKAIVIRIDSPGGSALASDVIWREIRKTSQDGIPVIASMGNVAASGGYYMAMGCDAIVAQPTTITGSIGVVSMRFDASSLYEKLKINVEVLKTAHNADFYDPHRALSEEELNAFYGRTEGFYRSFVSKAALSRGQEFETLEKNARGRVWTGRDALERNLVDQMGGLEDAVQLAASKAGIDTYTVRIFPQQKDFWTYLRESRNAQEKSAVTPIVQQLLPRQGRALLDCISANRTTMGCYAVTPYWIEIN